jgi:hypothetical protein
MLRDYASYHRYMAERLVMPFAWGREANDCISHGAGAIIAQSGRDVLDGLNWDSAASAARLIRKHGGVEAMISARLTPTPPAYAHRGDIGAIPGEDYLGGLAIVVIDGALLIGPGGMVARRSAMTMAWSID